MRKTETSFLTVQNTSLTRAMRLAAIALGVGLVMAAGPVRAGDDDEDDDRTFEEKIIDNLMTGIGGKNMESKGIEYRERSPLVVPPKLDLPPPAGAAAEVKASNWPKDPDDARRKAAIAARKKENKDPRAAVAPADAGTNSVSASYLQPRAPAAWIRTSRATTSTTRSSARRNSAGTAALAICSAATRPRRRVQGRAAALDR